MRDIIHYTETGLLLPEDVYYTYGTMMGHYFSVLQETQHHQLSFKHTHSYVYGHTEL